VNRYLIEGVAKAGAGEPFIVTSEAEAPVTAAKFQEYIQTPVLTDINVKTIGFDAYDVHPSHTPDLFAQRPIVVFGKWRGPATGTFELQGKTGTGDYASRVDVDGVQPDDANRALRYLWARSRIAELSDYGASHADPERVKAVTNLGLKYNLLTQYTSFIAVLENIRNTGEPAQDVNQPLPIPLGVTDMAVGSEPELIWLISASLILTLIMFLRYRRRFV
jgi:Ca-activated chloride channel family protein